MRSKAAIGKQASEMFLVPGRDTGKANAGDKVSKAPAKQTGNHRAHTKGATATEDVILPFGTKFLPDAG